ncbi:2-dehydro-3-deoxygalactonokinase [Epibacterium ulvae]|uniref:2-dehydro-3-deoxygalactonokinase n=1 Tax=Epibacterium ulvae TaxID=1156985 RepID=UPI00249336A0|nr:2-dehydro-3-deoxygalactonokinase [Epibacterium ulvae]
MTQPDFVAIDWGTSSFRLWVIGSGGKVLAQESGPFGMQTLSPVEYPVMLERLLSGLAIDTNIPVIICGMAGARGGWIEAPYVANTQPLHEVYESAVSLTSGRRRVWILPGIAQAQPANVMRGEETQILGFLEQTNSTDCVVCLPGTHSKWVRVANGRIKHFDTALTGEQFALLSQNSVLGAVCNGSDWDDAGFLTGLDRMRTQPAQFSTSLFEVRAGALLGDHNPGWSRAYLSGLLIGAELMATQSYWSDEITFLIGASELAQCYDQALTYLGGRVRRLNAETLTLAGLRAGFTSVVQPAN